jgi:hypothetical protein
MERRGANPTVAWLGAPWARPDLDVERLTRPGPTTRCALAPEAFDLGGLRVLVASLGGLMAMKRAGGREKDRLDLAELEVIARLRRGVERASG